MSQGLTITFCDRGENHVGNQQIGQLAENGLSCTDLLEIQQQLINSNITTELINLSDYLPIEHKIEASVLIIRNGIDIFTKSPESIWNELASLSYDKHALMYGRVCNKLARHNLCFYDIDQEAEYAAGKGTIVNYNKVPYLNHVRNYLPNLTCGKVSNSLVGEANFYYDINKCGIGYHGDAERKIVIGLRLGCDFPLCYFWYQNNKRISERINLNLHAGDMYIMSEKAVGFDWKKKSIPTLRHAAGCAKYID